MRTILFSLILGLCAPVSWANGSVSLKEAASVLQTYGASSVQAMFFKGTPHITATFKDRGIILRLALCEDDEAGYGACKAAIFSACNDTVGFSRAEALELTNAYSAEPGSRGRAYVEGTGVVGQKICVQLRVDLHQEDRFDMADVYDWQLTMRDFFDYVDAQARQRQTRSILGTQ